MLTDRAIKAAKPREKAYRLIDSGGLHLFITPAGSKLWRLRYEVAGKEQLMTIGPYPGISLVEARDTRDQAKKMRRDGRDPVTEKKLKKLIGAASAANTFEAVARQWHERTHDTWDSRHAASVLRSLERDIFPAIGKIPITGLTAPMILNVIRPVEERGARDTAHRLRQRISAVFVHGIATGVCATDPAAIISPALKPVKSGRQPAITDVEELRKALRRIEIQPGHPVTHLAHRLLALTAVRPGVLGGTRWEEFQGIDTDEPIWRIPADRMKGGEKEHIVPLVPAALEVIEITQLFTGKGPLAFPNARFAHKPMSENAMGFLIKRAGLQGKHVPHGWRASFSTIMNEWHPYDRWIIDQMLSHVNPHKVEGAYNRAEFQKRRRELAQEWADLLLKGALPLSALLGGPRR